ncbi:hypothetical protein EDD85DRAFT_795906 [Armillaria nabsnona]|nr:hypothetical protein EDD85DRAFT_795906 [Armillaria nabsnona]
MFRAFDSNMQEVTPGAGKHLSKKTKHTAVTDPYTRPTVSTLGNIAKKEDKARTFEKVTEGVAHAATHKRTECLSDMYDHVRLSNHKGWEDLYVCRGCSKIYSRKSGLKAHQSCILLKPIYRHITAQRSGPPHAHDINQSATDFAHDRSSADLREKILAYRDLRTNRTVKGPKSANFSDTAWRELPGAYVGRRIQPEAVKRE